MRKLLFGAIVAIAFITQASTASTSFTQKQIMNLAQLHQKDGPKPEHRRDGDHRPAKNEEENEGHHDGEHPPHRRREDDSEDSEDSEDSWDSEEDEDDEERA